LSVDWTRTYSTIDARSRRASQRAFLRNLARGEAYESEAPSLWDVTFRTAVAQAELEDRIVSSNFVDLVFALPDGGEAVIATTRPELLPACVAVVVNPDDKRHADLVGKEAVVPLFGMSVPIRAHRLADPEKGTGMAMICTFGDINDTIWWRELRLPLRSVIADNGTIGADVPGNAHARYCGWRSCSKTPGSNCPRWPPTSPEYRDEPACLVFDPVADGQGGDHDAQVRLDRFADVVVDRPGLQVVLGHPEASNTAHWAAA
jgi:tRNA synthetases class I (I, L, M and V)